MSDESILENIGPDLKRDLLESGLVESDVVAGLDRLFGHLGVTGDQIADVICDHGFNGDLDDVFDILIDHGVDFEGY